MKALSPFNIRTGILLIALCANFADAQDSTKLSNILPNPSFEATEPPPPNAQTAKTGAPADTWIPKTWNVWGAFKCPDDQKQAHSGKRCIYFNTLNGGDAFLRYIPMPIPDPSTWTVKFWARGQGQLKITAHDPPPPERWTVLKEQTYDLQAQWIQFEFKLPPPAGCAKWSCTLQTAGKTEAWIDDVEIGYPGLPALALPPDRKLEKDADTLLYLPFEEAFDDTAYFIKGNVKFSEDGKGKYGKSLIIGVNGLVATSSAGNIETEKGTIEAWFKFLAPGADGVSRSILAVPGQDGMWLGKDQYSHMCFSFSSGWRGFFWCGAQGYAYGWQPDVWRHIAVSWDKDSVELFVDGKLIAWVQNPALAKSMGDELDIGGVGMEIDDLRISKTARYHLPLPPAEKKAP